MGRQRLERTYIVCKSPECSNIIEVKVGSKYQKQFCCSRCANTVNKTKSKRRQRRVTYKKVPWSAVKEQVVTPNMLQSLPVGGSDTGGKFAKLCNDILRGEVIFTGTKI